MKAGPLLLFDLGGVLVESAGRRMLRELLPQVRDEDEVLARWDASRAVALFEHGAIGPDAFARAFLQEWELELGEAAFLDWFASWVVGFYPGAEDLLARLRGRHALACLSNTNALHWQRLSGVHQLFDFRFASHLTGFMKPDIQAYAHVLEETDIAAENVYFFDDLPANIDAARALGLNAIHVHGLAETEAGLRQAGFL